MEQDYWTEISNYFLERKGRGAFLAPKDIMIIQEWHSDGIPLSVALAGIEQSFHKIDSGVNIVSIFVCDKHVRDVWKNRNSSMEGIPLEVHVAEEDEADFFIFDQAKSFFQKKLSHAAEEGNTVSVEAFRGISEELNKNKQAWIDSDFFDVNNETSLKGEIEGIVLQELYACMPEETQCEIRRATEKMLEESHGVMKEENLEVTKSYMIKNKTFSHFSLPKSPFWFI